MDCVIPSTEASRQGIVALCDGVISMSAIGSSESVSKETDV